jgi:hypothetical protein
MLISGFLSHYQMVQHPQDISWSHNEHCGCGNWALDKLFHVTQAEYWQRVTCNVLGVNPEQGDSCRHKFPDMKTTYRALLSVTSFVQRKVVHLIHNWQSLPGVYPANKYYLMQLWTLEVETINKYNSEWIITTENQVTCIDTKYTEFCSHSLITRVKEIWKEK